MSSLTRRTVNNPHGGWRAASSASSTGNPAHASSAVVAPLTTPQRPVPRVPESVKSTDFVLYVEDNDDLRELVVELVTVVFNRRCVGVGSYEELVALGEEALECRVAILDINLGPDRRSGIDAYTWLRDQGYKGRIVFLTGHASTHPLVVEAQRIGDVEIFSKPIEPDRLRSIVEGERQ
jgi:FixJ family two-component response regulator